MFMWMMLGMRIPQVSGPGLQKTRNCPFSILSFSQYNRISIAFAFFWRNYLVEIPTAVEFLTLIAVGYCFQPISFRVVRIDTAVCALIKMVPYSVLATDAMMLHMIFHTTITMPLTVGSKSCGFWGFSGPSLRKWTPLIRFLAQDNERYDASE